MLFFELLQVSLGNRGRLTSTPTSEEWENLYDESERQAVTGILLHGIERLPAEQRPSQDILLQWIGVGQMIEQRNHLMDKRCIELLTKLKDASLTPTILKGQGIAQQYGKELRPLRQSGDIDVYVDCGLKKALAFAKSQGQEKVEWDYKHLHLKIWDDTEVEMHYHVEVLLNLWKNRKLQKWFREHENELFAHANDNLNANLNLKANTDRTNDTNGFVTPTVEFNVFYILLHIYRHFLYEGIGMRQIVDYYMVLRTVHGSRFTVHDYVDAVSQFGMERFAKGLMWVMQEALGMSREWMLWEPDEKEGKYILDEVMAGGNFGHHDERLQHRGGKWNTVKQVCRHNWHLMRHYPADVVWAPVWFVWHKCWKLKTKALLAIKS